MPHKFSLPDSSSVKLYQRYNKAITTSKQSYKHLLMEFAGFTVFLRCGTKYRKLTNISGQAVVGYTYLVNTMGPVAYLEVCVNQGTWL